jgi:hypothetical protein
MDVLVATWEAGLVVLRGDRREREIANALVTGLVPHREGALAIVGGKSLQKRSRAGEWTVIAKSTFEMSSCAVLGETIFVGTNDARVFRLDGESFVRLEAFEHVAGRETWYAGTAIIDGRTVGPPLGVRSMSATDDALLVNVHVGGIPRSVDRGATWSPTLDVEADAHEVRAHPVRREVVAAATAIGLALSMDGGKTWTITSDGLHAPHCSAVAFTKDDVYISASKDPFDKEGAVYRRAIDRAGPLERVAAGLPRWLDGKVDTGCIASSLGDVIAFADMGGHVYVSRGGAFECIAEGLPFPTGLLLLRA